MARDLTGEIQKMITKRDLRRISSVSFSSHGSSGGGVVLGNARIYRQDFTNVASVTVTHGLGVIPLVFVLSSGYPYGMGVYGGSLYSSNTFYYRMNESDYTVGYATDICIVDFPTAQTGQVICLG